MNWKIVSKSCLILSLFLATLFIGLRFVAPYGVLKTKHIKLTSSPADYGIRHDKLIAVSEDSLDLYGDILYPFHSNPGDTIPNICLIMMHPLNRNAKEVYPFAKPLVDLPMNILVFDQRGHGRSGGDYFTLGSEETGDIRHIIDMVLELYPNMRFGVFGMGTIGNVALQALETDPRLEFGIVESYYSDPLDFIKIFNDFDLGLENPWLAQMILDDAFEINNIKQTDFEIHPQKINKPILLLDSSAEPVELIDLFHDLSSADKFYASVVKHPVGQHAYPYFNDEYYSCIKEFLATYAY